MRRPSSRSLVLRLSIGTMLASVVAGSLATSFADDVIYDRNKKAKFKGTVTAVTPDSVAITTSAGDKTVPVSEIGRVKFDGEDARVDAARNMYISGRYKDCMDKLGELGAGDLANDYVKAEVGVYKALASYRVALELGEDKKPVEDALKKWAGANKDHYKLYEVAEALGDLAMAQNKYADAQRYYSQLSKSAAADTKMRGAVAEGRTFLAQEKFAEAAEKFDGVLGEGSNTESAREQKEMATVGKAVCSAATGKAADGIAELLKIIKAGDDKDNPRLFARAYNALGFCHLRAGADKEAILAYLHTHVLFFQDADSHAESLFHLVKLYEKANKTDRAQEFRTLLQQRYPGSAWTSKL